MLEPVHGNVGIEPRIVHDGGNVEHKEKPQRQRRQACREKEPGILPHHFEHGENIARLRSCSSFIFSHL